jgi:hypothetical protein
MRHRWPFSVHRILYVAVHESTKVHPLLTWERVSEDNNGSECAGLRGDRKPGLIGVIPNLHGDESDEQAEDGPKWR